MYIKLYILISRNKTTIDNKIYNFYIIIYICIYILKLKNIYIHSTKINGIFLK